MKRSYGIFGRMYRQLALSKIVVTDYLYSEPGIVKIFEQIWGTNDLIASFDGMNVSLPVNPKNGRTDIEETCELLHAVI